MNLKILKYNLYLMGVLSALIWGIEKNPEIAEKLLEGVQPVLEQLKNDAPIVYRSIASVVNTIVPNVPLAKNSKVEKKALKKSDKNEKKISKLGKEIKFPAQKSEFSVKDFSTSAADESLINSVKFFIGGGIASFPSTPVIGSKPAVSVNNPEAVVTNPVIDIVNPPSGVFVTPITITCSDTQEKIGNICVDLPGITSISNQSIKTTKEMRVPLTLSDDRYNCDNLTFTYNAEYINASDLTIVKENNDCFLKIKPSLNKSGTSFIGIKLSHNSKEIETQFTVELISLASIEMETFPSIIPKDLEFTPKVKGTFSDDSVEEISSVMTWESTNTVVIENLNEKVFKSKSIGTSTITASIKTFNVDKNVETQAWNNMFLSDYYVKGFLNSEVQLKAFVFLTNGSMFELTNYINWLSYQEECVYVDKGKSMMQGVGLAKIDVFFADQQKTAFISVNNKQIATVDIIGPSILTPWGQADYKVVANFDDGTSQDISALVDLKVVDPVLASIKNNMLLPLAIGSTKLSLTIGDLNFEKDISIDFNTLNSLKIQPSEYLAYKNQNVSYKILGVYSDGQEFDITDQANLTLSTTTLATLSNKSLSVTNATNSFGEATLMATVQGITGTTKVYLNPATISSTYIHMSGNLSVGSNYKLKVLANLSDGGIADLTLVSKFYSNDDNIVSVSNGYYNLGKVYGMNLGNANITAEVNGASITKNIIVDVINTVKDIGYGLTAEYYSGKTFTTYKGKRIDKNINFNWSNVIRAPMGLTNDYSVRWTGKFKAPATMNYYFCTDSDDGVKLWINNVLIINSYIDHAIQRDCSGVVALTKDQTVNLKLDFFENGGYALIKLYYGPSTGSQTIIPMEDFFPE